MEKEKTKIKKSTKRGDRENFAWHEFRTMRKFAPWCEFSSFCSSSAPDFKSVKLVLARIHRAWIDSTNLALKACKNYKINH